MINLKPLYCVTGTLSAILIGLLLAGAPIPWLLALGPIFITVAMTVVLWVILMVQVFTHGGTLRYTAFGRTIFTITVK